MGIISISPQTVFFPRVLLHVEELTFRIIRRIVQVQFESLVANHRRMDGRIEIRGICVSPTKTAIAINTVCSIVCNQKFARTKWDQVNRIWHNLL